MIGESIINLIEALAEVCPKNLQIALIMIPRTGKWRCALDSKQSRHPLKRKMRILSDRHGSPVNAIQQVAHKLGYEFSADGKIMPKGEG